VKSFALTTTLIAACLAFCAAPAFAMDEATKAALADCQNAQSPPQKGADACTKVLSNVTMGPQSTMAIHYYRGAFYMTAKSNDKAKADYAAAIATYDKDPGKADWSPDFVGLVASAYALRAQIELQAKECDAARADYGKAAATEREVSQRDEYEQLARNVCN
jgi:hypothetical protein